MELAGLDIKITAHYKNSIRPNRFQRGMKVTYREWFNSCQAQNRYQRWEAVLVQMRVDCFAIPPTVRDPAIATSSSAAVVTDADGWEVV